MTRLSEEEKQFLKYQIYKLRYDDPWISNKKIAEMVNHSVSTVNRYARQAEEKEIICQPLLGLFHPDRKTSLVQFKDKWKAFKELQKHPMIGYICVYQGQWDIMATYDGRIDFSQFPGFQRTVMEGLREKVFTPKVKYTSWEACFDKMENLLQQKDRFQESALDCDLSYPDWDEEEWILFDYFRPNLRKNFSDLRKKYPISWRKYGKWKQTLRKYCTIMLEYYTEGAETYDSMTLCLKTDYEKYIVTLFSNLPTTCFIYKIGEYMLITLFVPQDCSLRIRLYKIISQLINKKIITDYMDGNSITYYYSTEPMDLQLHQF